MYAFALRPKWWLSHLLALSLITAMIWASFWQRGRLHEVRDRNERIIERTAEQPIDIGELVGSAITLEGGDELEFRPVTATGAFDRSGEVLVRGRPLNGAPGSWVVTPLTLRDGRSVLVNRGWIPHSFAPDDDRSTIDAPAGQVSVSGWARPTQIRQGLGVQDAPTGTLSSLARLDIQRISDQVDSTLLPVFVQLERQDPEPGDLPVPVALPPLEEGSHFSYQMQWAIYATVGIIGYPLILRRVATNRRADEEHPSEEHLAEEHSGESEYR